MKKQIIVFLAVLLILLPALASATQFSIVGPRALGMGGAGVASVNDSTAVYWNPAALAQYGKVDIRIPAEAALRDHMDLKQTWTDINDIENLARTGNTTALVKLSELMTRLTKTGTGADLDASTGLLVSVPIGQSSIAVSAMGLGYAGMYTTADLFNLSSNFLAPNSVLNNRTAVTGLGIGLVEPAVSFSTSFGKSVFVGGNAKMIYAQTYVNTDYILNPLQAGDNSWSNFSDNMDNSKQRSDEMSVDLGVIFVPMEGLSIGIVGRDLNSPKFPVSGTFAYQTGISTAAVGLLNRTTDIELKPQVRAGIAWNPYPTLTLAADLDLTKNETLVTGFEDRTIAVGLEQTLADEYFSIRVGAYRNLADSDSNIVYTAGLGTRILAFRLDLAAAYDFKEQEYQASLNLALKF